MPQTPYDPLESVLNTSRVRLNDAIQSLAGQILTDIGVFTPAVVNAAWRRLQELLANFGFARLKQEIIFPAVPATTNLDVGSQVWLDWTGYFDGTSEQSAPALPSDFISPLLLWERVTGSAGNYPDVDRVENGLPTAPKQTMNKLWEWRDERIYMPGATGTTDLRVRYAALLPDFNIGVQTVLTAPMMIGATTAAVAVGTTILNGYYIQIAMEIMLVTAGGGTTTLTVTRGQLGTNAAAQLSGANVLVSPVGIPVPIMRSLNSFAWYVCSEMAKARGDLDAGDYDQRAQVAATMIYNFDPEQARSIYKDSEYGKMTDKYTPIAGPAGPRGMQGGT